MSYTVFVTPEAEGNIIEAYGYIAERSPLNAVRWLRGLHQQIERLEHFPRRFSEARENDYFAEELRQVVYKSHRIVFTIDDGAAVVRVVHVRHAKRRPVGESEIDEVP